MTDLQSERRRALMFLCMGNSLATFILAGLGYIVRRQMQRPVSTLARQVTGANEHR
ncbi:hypothetical protein [Maritimibacter sp. 55A14]|uniref:hypothetical protein n=1 Tax=Maritimibacter sp. 55A14 TaxID=2174844 RepID=UPI001304AB06|nr:hypothetical protein [Maritimibacter sp. 55A14]